MALTRITKGVIKPNENYDTHDINSTGIITATGANITGNMTVGGVLTYEDVSSIDAVGIITANQGIHVGAGISAVGVGTFGNIVVGTGGSIAVGTGVTIESNGNAVFTGIITSSSDIDLISNDAQLLLEYPGRTRAHITANYYDRLDIATNSSSRDIRFGYTQYGGNSSSFSNPPRTIFFMDMGEESFKVNQYGVGYGVTLNGTGNATFTGIVTATSADINGDLDVDGHTNLDNVNIVGVTTTNGNLNVNGVSYLYGSGGAAVVWGNTGYSGHLSFDGSNNAVIRAASGKALIFQTDHVNTRVTIGSQGNVSIEKDLDVDGHTNLDNVSAVGFTTIGQGNFAYTPQSSSWATSSAINLVGNYGGGLSFNDNGNGGFVQYLDGNGSNFNIKSGAIGGATATSIKCVKDGSVELYWNNEKKLQTNYEGIQVYDTSSTQSMIRMNTSSGLSGALYAVGNSVISLIRANLQWGVKVNNTGSTELYHTGNAKKLETTSTGISINQDLDVDGHTELDNVNIAGVTTFANTARFSGGDVIFSGTNNFLQWDKSADYLRFMDGVDATFGNSDDLKIYHSGTDTYIANATNNFRIGNTGSTNLKFFTNNSTRWNIDGSGHFVPDTDSQVDIGTNSVRVRNIYADTLYGDGSNLTGITQTTINSNTNNYLITGTGTANTLQGEANLTWDGSILSASGSDAQLRLYDTTTSGSQTAFRVMAYNGVTHFQSGTAFSSDSKAPIIFGSMFGGTEWLRITSAGDVGIGYNSPTVKLHVREAASGASSYDNRHHIIVEDDAEGYLGFYMPNSGYAGIRFYDTTGQEGLIDYYYGNDEMHFHSSGTHIFKNAGTETFRIESGGAVKMSTNNAKIRMGSGHPFELYHNGTYSYISDNRSGGSDELRIAGRAVRILNQDSSSTTGYFSYNSAKLYYTNYEKLSTVTSGVNITGTVKASSPTSHRNYFINGACTIWQRAIDSNNHSSIYTCDRWWRANNASRVQRSTTTPTGTGNGVVTHPFPFSMHVTSNGSNASIGQAIELTQTGVSQFKHSTSYTLSMYVRTASGTSTINAYVYYRNSKFSTQNQTNWSGSAGNNTYWNMGTATTTWQRFEKTFTSPANPNSNNQVLAVEFNLSTSFYVTGLQFEEGQVATPFEYRDNAEELSRCQRYFNVYHLGTQEWLYFEGATSNHKWWQCPIPAGMRSEPSITKGGTCSSLNLSAAGGGTISSFGVTSIDNGGAGGTTHQGAMGRVSVRIGFTGNIGGSYEIRHTDGWGNGAGWLEFDSEM